MAEPNIPSMSTIPDKFGIWTVTASFRLPSSLSSPLLGYRPARRKWVPWLRFVKGRAADSDDAAITAEGLHKVEGELAEVFCKDTDYILKGLSRFWSTSSSQLVSPHQEVVSGRWLNVPCFAWASLELRFLVQKVVDQRFDNEFVIYPKHAPEETVGEVQQQPTFEQLAFNATRNLAGIIANRRSYHMTQALAQRTYNLFLPPGLLDDSGEGARTYIGFPVVNFLRFPDAARFRRTFSLTLLLVPVDSNYESRPLGQLSIRAGGTERSVEESDRLRSGFEVYAYEEPVAGTYELRGPLLGFLQAGTATTTRDRIAGPLALRDLIQELLASVATRTASPHEVLDSLRDSVLRAISVSRFSSYVEVLSEISEAELAAWQRTPDPSAKVSHIVSGRIQALSGREWTRDLILGPLEQLDIVPGQGARWLSPNLYLPWVRFIYSPFPIDTERDGFSILWNTTYRMLMTTGLSALRETLSVFYREMERVPNLESAREFLTEFVFDIEEYFDFDLSAGLKSTFEALKRIDGVDIEFNRLYQKIQALQVDKIVEEHVRLSRRLLWWTAVLALLTVITILTGEPLIRLMRGIVQR